MIEVKNLSIQIGGFSLKNVNLSVNDHEYFIILGPSGAGKTVFLECLAGLHRIKKGEIRVDGENIAPLSPEERKIGYVPQDYVLFPFLNVAENIQFGLKRGQYDKSKVQEKTLAMAGLFGITHLLERDTLTLSGGEKQRVALARALATSPKILLMDEPFSALDPQTSKYLRTEMKQIHRRLGITTIYVTHDLMEAVNMADRLAIVMDGQIEQVDEPEKLLFSPCNERVSDFIGAPNILDCDYCESSEQGIIEVSCQGLKLVVPHDGDNIQKVAILPRHIYVSETKPRGPGVNSFIAKIVNIMPRTEMMRVSLEIGDKRLIAEIPHHIYADMDLEPGKNVYVILRMKRIRAFERSITTTSPKVEFYK
jgi:ABC-type sugar transport system ATPase subunit